MGKYSSGNMNEYGEYLAKFCGNNNVVIGGTYSHTKKYISWYVYHLVKETKNK